MRIAQVAPLVESVPPKEYGGTERVVAYLTDELVRLGHEVTLFASGDSQTSARLVPMAPRALRNDPDSIDAFAQHIVMLERISQVAGEFDIIHYHVDYLHYPFSRRSEVPHVTTLHGRLDIADLQPLYDEYMDMPVISISDAQREPLPQANWQATIYHGLPHDLFAPSDRGGDYLVFVGRISPEKRVDRAIAIAERTGLRLRIAAKIDEADAAYAKSNIEGLFELPFVEFLGEVGGADKEALIRGARALLFPIGWREPFGLVMIEAMACGTPVVAWREGSVPEVIAEGTSGFIVDSIDAAVEATRRAGTLDRREVRREFERRFTADRMAREYVAVYEGLIGRTQQKDVQAAHESHNR